MYVGGQVRSEGAKVTKGVAAGIYVGLASNGAAVGRNGMYVG
jgi:hypothetical protein